MRGRAAGTGLLLCLAAAGPAFPQATAATGGTAAEAAPAVPGPIVSPVLTLDQDRLFAATAWGRRAEAAVEAASVALATENRRIEGDLAAEEKTLTEKRAGMTPEAFRAEADAFDTRVVAFRKTQDAKARDIGTMRDAERKAFFSAVLPVMAGAMKERGAVVILDARSIFVSVNAIDITDEMIARIDAAVGAGTPPSPQPAPQPAPAP